jgi:hypothetical protein
MELEAFADRELVKEVQREKGTQGEEQPSDESAALRQKEKE